MKQLLILIVLALPNAASAYIGPGAGIGAIGTVIALIGTLLLIVIGFIWYPIKRLLRHRAASENITNTDNAVDKDSE